MAIEVALGTPLADSLQNAIQPKLVENGWSTGGLDDNALAEYILLMLVNGKTQDELAAELSNELLGLGPEDSGAIDFAKWLFEQVNVFSGQGGQTSTVSGDISGPVESHQPPGNEEQSVPLDAEMDDANDGLTNIPTGPRSMQNSGQRNRDKRMLGQMNKTLEHSIDAPLHKVRGAAGAGRINSHARDPPKGPTPKGPRNMMSRNMQQRQMGGPAVGANAMANPMGAMTPKQQMALFAMYEEQARMMAQILSPQQQQQMFPTQTSLNGHGGIAMAQQTGKSLFDRVQTKSRHMNGNFNKRQQNGGEAQQTEGSADVDMDTDGQHGSKPDPSTTMCTFNLACTRLDCHFVHQSPVAPPGVSIDMTDECSYGAACMNRKCVGKHPSPAKKTAHKAEMDCKFYPNCTNPACPFRHPSTPPCRNGADCTIPNCKFSHSTVACKFNPCLNPACVFKHADGQKRGAFEDKVWIGGQEGREHVSERKFVDEMDGDEELILPMKSEPGMEAVSGQAALDVIS